MGEVPHMVQRLAEAFGMRAEAVTEGNTTDEVTMNETNAGLSLNEVTSHAKPGCRFCSGDGLLTVVTGSGPVIQADRQLRVCGCAIRRWRKAQGIVEYTDKGQFGWRYRK